MQLIKTIARLAASTAVVVVATMGSPDTAEAATITVTTLDDELNSDADCSLREAIQAANTNATVDACTAGSGADTITLPTGTYALSISGAGEDSNATGDLDISDDLTINGQGATSTIIDGGTIDRVLDVSPGVAATFAGVTITGGDSGAGVSGGGVRNRGSLTIDNSVVTGNAAGDTTSVGAGAGGGGVLNDAGTLVINNSPVSSNVAFTGGVLITLPPAP